MDQSQQYVQELEKLFHASKDVLITTKAAPRVDGICAVLALGKAFESMPLTSLTGPGQQRKVVKAISGRQGTQYSMLPASDQIVSELGLRDFVIGLPGYIDKSVDSVSWYVDQGKLHVVLKSNPAVPMQFDPKLFDPFYAGANFDVVCVVDADSPADLGNLYRQDPGMFTELPVVNISNSMSNTRYGKVNVVDTNVSSTSELVYEMLSALHVHVDSDTAALLLCGIDDGTENMTQRATPRTQEIVDQLKSIASQPYDVRAVRGQAQAQPLPIHPQGVVPAMGNVPGMQPGMPPYAMPGMNPQGMPPGGAMPYAYGAPGMNPGQMPQQGAPMYPMPAGYPQPNPYGQMPQINQPYPGQQPQYNQPQAGMPTQSPMPAAPSAFSQFHGPANAPQAQNQGYQQYNQPQYGQQGPQNQNPWDMLNQQQSGNNYGNGGNEGTGGRV